MQVPGKGGATGALKLLGLAAACLCLAGPVPSVASDAYPTRPVRWIVPFTPGGTTDILARIFGQRLSERLGQQFIVENKPGGGANIGTDAVVRSPADGYTLLLVGSVHAINATLYQKLPYNFIRDIAPVVGFARVPNVMEVHPSVPVGSVAEFIAYARSNPGTLNMASSGSGTTIHLGGELFKAMAGVNLLHVPYRGSAPALTDLLSGRVQVMFDNAPSSIAHIRAGKLRALAVTTLERSAAFPDLPTVSDTVPGYEVSAWFGMGVPKGTPPEVIETLYRGIDEALADPVIRARLAELGIEPLRLSPAAFAAHIAAETEKWGNVVRISGATAD